jgi:hypothetical protein
MGVEDPADLRRRERGNALDVPVVQLIGVVGRRCENIETRGRDGDMMWFPIDVCHDIALRAPSQARPILLRKPPARTRFPEI